VDRGPGWQAAAGLQGVEAVAGKLLGRHVVADLAGLGALGQQVADEVAELLACSGDVLAPMQECSQVGALVLVGDEGIGLEHGLDRVARQRAGGFSLGMAQRLGIAAALLGDPPVLMFDEPVNGLDPEGVLWIRNLLKSLAAQGRTVFLSSHLMSEMSLTADRLIIIGRGRLIAQTTVADFLTAGSGNFVRVRSAMGDTLASLLEARGAAVARQADGALHVTGATTAAIGELARANGLALQELSAHQASLEERYMELTKDSACWGCSSSPANTARA
jgi:ABC-type glutathione transport system ATPase component